ncbi:MAG: carbon-nitrogen hydrolase family protein [Alphaproteobacteria bacterium]|nr:carbon-nitrogen hydrolase family protein [Alphaproteobacteria bacterium]
MTPFAIGGIQMHVAAAHENVSHMKRQLDLLMARFPWVQMAVFSELAAFGPIPAHAGSFERTEEAMASWARHHGIWLVSGSMFEHAGDELYNTSTVFSPDGGIAGRHRKLFPFAPYEQGVTPGTKFLAFDVPKVGRFGVSICYDIWFPETTRTLAAMGVEVLLHPVLTGTIERDVEVCIARATAAMFQCYVFDINGLGAGGYGRSAVFDPAGTLLYQAAGQEELIPIEIDLAQVRRQRETGLRSLGQPLKSFRDRRVEFPVYRRDAPGFEYLDTLGPLAMPARGTRAGLGEHADEAAADADEPSAAGPFEVIDGTSKKVG